MASKQEEIREGMAEKAHLVWQRWMAYMLTHLDEEHIERWKRQANTAYKDLPESEKASDRNIADGYSEYLHSQGVVLKVEGRLPKPKDPKYLMWTEQEVKEAGYTLTKPLIGEE